MLNCVSFIKHKRLEIILKYKDKQAHLERCNVLYKLKWSCGHSYIGQTQRNLNFHLNEQSFVLASAFNYRELLITETLLIQEQQPEINVDNFSNPLYLFNA